MQADAQQPPQPVTYKRPPGRPFPKGVSPNPGGKPKLPKSIKELAQLYTDDSIKALASIVRSPKASASARVRAAEVLIERGHGRAPLAPEDKDMLRDGAISLVAALQAMTHPQQVVSPPVVDVTPQSVITDEPAK